MSKTDEMAGWRQWQLSLLFFAAGALLLLLPCWGAWRYLEGAGYKAQQAAWLALIFSVCLEMVWLPLLALAAVDGAAGGARGFAAIFAGATIAGAAIDFAARGASGDVLWAQAMCLAVAALAAAICRLAAANSLSPAAGKCLATAILAFIYTNPFWARLALESVADVGKRNLFTHISVWLAPIPCLSIAFEGFNFATDLGKIYRIWLGPVVPYPPHPLAFTAVYLLAAGALYAVAAGLARVIKK